MTESITIIRTQSGDEAPAWEAGQGGPCASTDDNDFAGKVSAWLIDREIPFRYDFQDSTGLHVFTVDNKPNNLKSAFDAARRMLRHARRAR